VGYHEAHEGSEDWVVLILPEGLEGQEEGSGINHEAHEGSEDF